MMIKFFSYKIFFLIFFVFFGILALSEIYFRYGPRDSLLDIKSGDIVYLCSNLMNENVYGPPVNYMASKRWGKEGDRTPCFRSFRMTGVGEEKLNMLSGIGKIDDEDCGIFSFRLGFYVEEKKVIAFGRNKYFLCKNSNGKWLGHPMEDESLDIYKRIFQDEKGANDAFFIKKKQAPSFLSILARLHCLLFNCSIR